MSLGTVNRITISWDAGATLAVTARKVGSDGTLGDHWDENAGPAAWDPDPPSAFDTRKVAMTAGSDEYATHYSAVLSSLASYTGIVEIYIHDDADVDNVVIAGGEFQVVGGIITGSMAHTASIETDAIGADAIGTDALGALELAADAAIEIAAAMAAHAEWSDLTQIQSDLTQALATLATIAGYLDTEVAAILSDTGISIPALLATAQADLDIITGADGVNLLSATQASIDAIETDTTTDIPALIATAQADLDIITGASGVNLLTATQASIDAIEADTAEIVNLPAANVAAIDSSSTQLIALALGQVAIQGTGFVKDTHSLTNVQGDLDTITDSGVTMASGEVVDANLIQIEGHALAGTGTRIADGFEFFFDVATPAHTVAQVFPTNFEDLSITDTTGKVTADMTGVTGTSEQEPVPRNRTWVLVPGGNGLEGDEKLEIQANEVKMYSMDFSVDAEATIIQSVDLVETEAVTSDLTFEIDGRDHKKAKFTITCASGATDGEHRVRCRVTYATGETVEGDGRLQVSA